MNTVRKTLAGVMLVGSSAGVYSQTARPEPKPEAVSTQEIYVPAPAFDPKAMDKAVDPCNDFYKYACGNFATSHPIPADQRSYSSFSSLSNVVVQSVNDIIKKAAEGGADRTPDEQKIGDGYSACMDVAQIEAKGISPVQPILTRIDSITSKGELAKLVGELHRQRISMFFHYGREEDPKESNRQIASISQSGPGLPEKGYYLRTGDKDVTIRKQYVVFVAKMLELSGETPAQAASDADSILQFETTLAKASMDRTEMRDPLKTYHLESIAEFEKTMPGFDFTVYEGAVHSPHVSEIDVSTPTFFPAMMTAIQETSLPVLKAYMRYHTLSRLALQLPQNFQNAFFGFYGHDLNGMQALPVRWKTCSASALSDALGRLYVKQYFTGSSKAKMNEMVSDIEAAMEQDINGLTWMSAQTKQQAREKLHRIVNKVGYPDKWRDYDGLIVLKGDLVGNSLRASAFFNDREMGKIGKPTDRSEWEMAPYVVNAYYSSSMNDINFPAGFLQPPFYDPKADDAINYGHIGSIIGHELTHGFDDQGKKFDGHGNLNDWWTAEDTKNFEARTDCLEKEYSGFTAVDDVKVDGKLTLGENTADNGGLLLAYMAYLERAKKDSVDLQAKKGGFTAPQRFYIAFAQNSCNNSRPEGLRQQVLVDPHSPSTIRVNGVIVNQPGFAEAFGCKKGSPMVPEKSCRVW